VSRSDELWKEAQERLVGGVNSPVRAFKAVGGTPVWFARGEGAYLTDVDGKRYVDLVGSWGPLILGHAHPAVVQAVTEAVQGGSSFGAPGPRELELARLVSAMMPSIEMVRFVNSGTEAVMSAIRLARAATGRDVIVKFEGGYHGHADSLLVAAGSGAMTLGIPDSPGVPAALAALTAVLPYNDSPAVEAWFAQNGYRVLWIAHWTSASQPTVPAADWGGNGWAFWQHSSTGTVPGISGAATWGPGPFEEHHPLELAWYAIHPVELLYTTMGTGCESVTRCCARRYASKKLKLNGSPGRARKSRTSVGNRMVITASRTTK